MSQKSITNFFKRPADKSNESDGASTSKISNLGESSEKAVTASLKTVKKWQKELNVDLEIVLSSDSSTVTQMSCKTCKMFAPADSASKFVTGTSRIKIESLKSHLKSVSHLRASDAKIAAARKSNNKPSKLEEGFQKIDASTSEKMCLLFKTAYHVAVYEKPFTDFERLIELQNANGISLGDTYVNDQSARKFVSEISGEFRDNVYNLLHEADYFSVFCDGSTDRTETEKEVILVKVLENYYPKVKYLKLEQPENTKATGILEAINKAFTEFDLRDYKQKTVGFCSDGASVMMGARRGVITLMKQEGNADWILSVWCLAHRLELAVKDASKGTYMDKVIEMLASIYQFYKGSAKRNKEAIDIAELLGEHFLKPEKTNGTRWVSHKLKAVTKLLKNWPIIVTQMENYAEDASNKSEDRAKVRGYLKLLKQHKMVMYMAFVQDVLNEVAKISLLFQREDITVCSAVTKLQSAEGTLRQLYDNEGPAVVEIRHEIQGNQYRGHTLLNMLADDSCALTTDKQRIVQSMIDCIATRFDNILSDSIYLSCNAFDHKNWPLLTDRAALLLYGIEDVRVVFRHFATVLQNANCDILNALSQWNDLKIHVASTARYSTMHPLLVWQLVSQEDSDKGDYKDILLIIHLTSVYPLSNASCERAFSTMKRIKTDWRCNLGVDMMDILMRISVANIRFKDFDPRPAVRRWWLNDQRRKRPNTAPYGPRN